MLACIATLLVTGCGSATITTGRSIPAATSTRESGSASPTAEPSAPSQAGQVGLACRLPVVSGQMQGAFINFPDSNPVADPAGAFTWDQGTNTFRSNAKPVLRGGDQNRELFFARAKGRWLPAPRVAVLADGSGYAYVNRNPTKYQNDLHIVDVASGNERVFVIDRPIGYSGVMDYSGSGVYVSGITEGSEAAIWLVDPVSGSEHLVAGTGGTYDLVLAQGAAWLAYDKDPNHYTGGWDSIDRMDLATGKRTLWFHRDGAHVVGVGFAHDGTPIMYPSFTTGVSEVWLASAPNSSSKIFSGVETFTGTMSDAHGSWFFSTHGIYLYSPQRGFRRVSAAVAGPAGSCS
jgi:hypothetical protein